MLCNESTNLSLHRNLLNVCLNYMIGRSFKDHLKAVAAFFLCHT